MIITSKDNPKIKEYVKLSANKKYRRDEKKFVLEGARLCADAFYEYKEGRLVIYSAFATENALEKYSEYVDRELFYDDEKSNFYLIDDGVSSKISDTKAAQGIYVIAGTNDKILCENELHSDGKYLVLDNLQDPGNVGTILRTADAVGVDGVIMCADCCELYNPKTIRSAMGSVLRLNVFICDSFFNTLSLLHNSGIKVYASVIDSDAQSITDVDYSCGCAVVIGNEGNGMPEEDSAICDKKITIRMNGNINSLNAAMAGGIMLWEMFRGDNCE